MGEENITSNIHLHDDQADDAEETLSLCDLPLDLDSDADNNPKAEEAKEALSLCELALDLDADSNNNPKNHLENMPKQSRRSSSVAAPEFFEFLSDRSSDMCPAEDMIFCGKLIPLEQSRSFQKRNDCPSDERTTNRVLRKRSESISELRSRSTRSDITKNTKLLRNGSSTEYQKHQRHEMERNPSIRRVGKSDVSSPKNAVKPKWYGFTFRLVKFPREMERKDIKSRQFQRSSSAIFPPEEDGGKKSAGNRSSGKTSSWGVLNALSCIDQSSVAVKASF